MRRKKRPWPKGKAEVRQKSEKSLKMRPVPSVRPINMRMRRRPCLLVRAIETIVWCCWLINAGAGAEIPPPENNPFRAERVSLYIIYMTQ
ncbi:hypothetical protein Micbo1qcDRAFT_48403 [Microdochium bolleyi]|uniref:Uncharacterized protein n=1 Tax=Microdochium bolleyi TaxID=196109 RepID=A0A136IL92_9PEZI|nr:hypothetical protein Micbo1qcDRAFT_48403 [Microdochium bolleyi]